MHEDMDRTGTVTIRGSPYPEVLHIHTIHTPIESVVGPFEDVYSGPVMDSNSVWTVQLLSNFDDDGARPVPYLQLVSPVVLSHVHSSLKRHVWMS